MRKIRNIFLVLSLLTFMYIVASFSIIEMNDSNYYAKTDSGTMFILKCCDPGMGLMEKTLYRRSEIIPFYVKVKDLDEISGYPTAIAFADERTGYITVTYHGQDFSVYMSNDGGKNWHGIAVDAPDDISYNYIDAETVSFDDNGDGTLILDFVSDERILKYRYHFIRSESSWEAENLLEITYR